MKDENELTHASCTDCGLWFPLEDAQLIHNAKCPACSSKGKDFVTKEEIKASQRPTEVWRDTFLEILNYRNENYMLNLIYGAMDLPPRKIEQE